MQFNGALSSPAIPAAPNLKPALPPEFSYNTARVQVKLKTPTFSLVIAPPPTATHAWASSTPPASTAATDPTAPTIASERVTKTPLLVGNTIGLRNCWHKLIQPFRDIWQNNPQYNPKITTRQPIFHNESHQKLWMTYLEFLSYCPPEATSESSEIPPHCFPILAETALSNSNSDKLYPWISGFYDTERAYLVESQTLPWVTKWLQKMKLDSHFVTSPKFLPPTETQPRNKANIHWIAYKRQWDCKMQRIVSIWQNCTRYRRINPEKYSPRFENPIHQQLWKLYTAFDRAYLQYLPGNPDPPWSVDSKQITPLFKAMNDARVWVTDVEPYARETDSREG